MIALGSDHGGFALKSAIIKHLEIEDWNTKITVVTTPIHVIIPYSGVQRQKRLQTAHVIKEL